MKRVYYLTGAQFALSNIALKRLKVSRFAELNDPFEFLGADLSDATHRKAVRATKEQINRDRGLICFSNSWRNPVLWGHYAEKHRGIALGFDVPAELLKKVNYAKKPFAITFVERDGKTRVHPTVTDRLVATKFSDWRYEDEMRLFVGLDHDVAESGMYFVPFSGQLVLREVILGPHCELPQDGIRDMVSEFNPPVSVIKARVAFKSFSVVTDRLKSGSNDDA